MTLNPLFYGVGFALIVSGLLIMLGRNLFAAVWTLLLVALCIVWAYIGAAIIAAWRALGG